MGYSIAKREVVGPEGQLERGLQLREVVMKRRERRESGGGGRERQREEESDGADRKCPERLSNHEDASFGECRRRRRIPGNHRSRRGDRFAQHAGAHDARLVSVGVLVGSP